MTRWIALSVLLCSCSLLTGAPPPLPLDEPGHPVAWALDRLPATWELSQRSLPVTYPSTEVFVLRDISPVPQRSGRWSAPLPFRLDASEARFAPPGMVVRMSGVAMPYSLNGQTEGRRGWRVVGKQIHIWSPARPLNASLVIEHPALTQRVRRLQPADSGLGDEAFVHYTLRKGDISRRGLLLPAPARATWQGTLPPGARFSTWLAVESLPLDDLGSDGVVARLVLSAGGTEHSVAERAFPATSAAFEPWSVDLSPWAGQQVQLSLVTEAGLNADHDYAFFGSPTVRGTGANPPRRVIVVGIDTLRKDHLGLYGYDRPTSPNLDALAERSAVFDQAWTPAPRTRPSFRSALTGRRPLDAVGATNLGEYLGAEGFATAGIVANIHLNSRFGFDRGYDWWHADLSAEASSQVDHAIGWLEAHRDDDAFLFLHLMDPHLPYNPPEALRQTWVQDPVPDMPRRFNRVAVARWMRKGKMDAQRKQHVIDLYDAEIADADAELGRLFAAVEALPGPSLIIVHNDHGEEFWDHGGFEHNHTLYNEVVGGVLMVHVPGAEPRRSDVPSTLADIVPTVLDFVGVQAPALDGVSLRVEIDGTGEPIAPRSIGLGHLMYSQEQWGAVVGTDKYGLRVADGHAEHFDLAVDPSETQAQQPAQGSGWLDALQQAHGAKAGPGWRVVFSGAEPFTLALPAPALEARVLDPEALRDHRANQAWGELPPLRADDVASLTLSVDARSLVITPSGVGGVVQVLFDTPQAPAQAPPGVQIEAGPVLFAPPSEAERMRQEGLAPASAADDERALLESLGYLSPPEADSDDGASGRE